MYFQSVWKNTVDPDQMSSLESRPRGYKTFFILNSLSTTFILLINVEMPTSVGILTFISMINTTSEILEARRVNICRYFSFYEQ